jgi:hypothetical protein
MDSLLYKAIIKNNKKENNQIWSEIKLSKISVNDTW